MFGPNRLAWASMEATLRRSHPSYVRPERGWGHSPRIRRASSHPSYVRPEPESQLKCWEAGKQLAPVICSARTQTFEDARKLVKCARTRHMFGPNPSHTSQHFLLPCLRSHPSYVRPEQGAGRLWAAQVVSSHPSYVRPEPQKTFIIKGFSVTLCELLTMGRAHFS